MGKVFGVGVSRTGTTSLATALAILGYKTLHFPPLDNLYQLVNDYDALVDTPVACEYQRLDAQFPGSKFVLTLRDAKSWLFAAQREFTNRDALEEQWVVSLRARLYGSSVWNPDLYLRSMLLHNATVQQYFLSRPRDLLVMNIIGGEGWEPLCRFLDKPMPSCKFPRLNRKWS